MFKIVISLLSIAGSTGMVVNPLRIKSLNWMTNQFNSPNAERIIDPVNDEPTNKSVIFFPASTVNRLPTEMYNDFLYSLAEKNIKIYVPKKNNIENLVNDVDDKNNEITVVAHSTAAVDAIKSCQTTDIVDNLILIDPLDTRGVNKNEDESSLLLNTINKLVILNSEKSNDWKLLPVVLPIGVFALDENSIRLGENIVKETVYSETFGHFDILDNTWANIIHNTISKGSEDRNPLKLHKYRQWVVDIINKASSISSPTKALKPESYVSKNYS